jgi:GGDEF domain-containing protein
VVSLDLGMPESDAVLIAVGAALDDAGRAFGGGAYRCGPDEFIVPIYGNDHAAALAFAHAGIARIDALRLASRTRGTDECHVELNAVVCAVTRARLGPGGGLGEWIAEMIWSVKSRERGRRGFVVDTLSR